MKGRTQAAGHMWRPISNNYRGFAEEREWAASRNGLQCRGRGQPVSGPRYNTTIVESSGHHKPKVDLPWYNWGENPAALPHLFSCLSSVTCSRVLSAGLV